MVRKPSTESTHSNTPAQSDRSTGDVVHVRDTVPEAYCVYVTQGPILVPDCTRK